jgi:hypothetical protein
MTPKEKAKELVDKYSPICDYTPGNIGEQKEKAKQCALIASEEIIESWLTTFNTASLYWKAVKDEIQKI